MRILQAESSCAQGFQEAHSSVLPCARPRNLLQRQHGRRHRSTVRQVQPATRLNHKAFLLQRRRYERNKRFSKLNRALRFSRRFKEKFSFHFVYLLSRVFH